MWINLKSSFTYSWYNLIDIKRLRNKGQTLNSSNHKHEVDAEIGKLIKKNTLQMEI